MGVRTVGIGNQDFETIRKKNCFYIDKTGFIKEWWENMDTVTLIARPRRFGKTLTMNMTEKFFSVRYAGRGDLFDDRGRKIQSGQEDVPGVRMSGRVFIEGVFWPIGFRGRSFAGAVPAAYRG